MMLFYHPRVLQRARARWFTRARRRQRVATMSRDSSTNHDSENRDTARLAPPQRDAADDDDDDDDDARGAGAGAMGDATRDARGGGAARAASARGGARGRS